MPRKQRTLRERIEKLEADAGYAMRKAGEWQEKATAKQALANTLRMQAAEAAGGPTV